MKTIIYIAADVRSGSTLLDNMLISIPKLKTHKMAGVTGSLRFE